MAPTPQITRTREQEQALAKARARARISANGAGLGPVNPMVAEGQRAQKEAADAGADFSKRDPSIRPVDPLAPRKPGTPAAPSPPAPANRFVAPEGTWRSPENAERMVQATAATNKATRELEAYRASRPEWMNQTSDFLIGKLKEGDQALAGGAKAALDVIDPNREGSRFINENVTPFAGLRENNELLRGIPQWAATVASDPVQGAAEATEVLEPTHMIARGGNNLRDAAGAAVRGDWKTAQAEYSEATPDLLFGTLGVTPFGSMAVSAAKRGVAAPGEALRAQMGRAAEGFRQFDAPAVVEPPPAQPGPKPAQPGPSGPAPQSAPVAQAPIPQLAPAVAPSVAVQSNLPNGFFQSIAGDGYKHKAGYSPNVGVAIQSNTPSAQTTSYIRKDGGYGDARELNYVDESSLQDVWHPSNDAAKAEAVDLLNRMGGEADNARYKAMQDRLKKVVADDQAGTYAPESPASSAAPVVQPTAPQAPPRPTQPRPASTGQQPNAGNAAPGAGPAPAAAAQPVLNATPAAAQSPIALAKSDAKIIGRLLQAGGVPRNDVNNLLTGLVQAYQGSNSSRLPLAFFAEEYLPTVLPKQTADDVIQKLRGFGRERYSANGPKDTSRSTMRNTVDTLRSTQQDNLSGVMDANLYKGKLIGQEDKLNAQLEQNARTAYTTALENANNRLLNGKATQAERDALGEIQALLHNGAFLKEVPAHLRIKAMRDGINLEDYVQKDPIAAAHWLQSELRQAVTAAEGVGGMATSESRLYGEMRTTLLEQLEKVVPGYRGARKAHGDIYGAKEAIEFGGNFFKSARSEVETARLARQFKAMSVRQKTAATMSIRDALKNEFRNKAEDTAAKVTRLQQAGVLDALETVLGADGKRVADAIRNTVKENERIRAVDMMSGSNTADNLAQMEAAQEAVRSPVNKAIGSLGDNRSWAATLTGDALLAVNGLPPVLTGGKIASSAVGKLGKPSARKLASATKTLYDLPAQTNALAAPRKPTKVSGPRAPKPTPDEAQATLDDLLNQYSAIDHRANPAAGQKLLRQIERLKKQLATPNALAPPPSPPVKAGFGGSKPLDMSEPARMQRAREQGFDVDTPLYHGTTEAFEEFDPAKTGSKFGYDKKGFFFSDDPRTARSYSYTPDEKRDSWARFSADGKAMADARTVKAYVRLKNPITLEELAAHPEYKRAAYEDPTDIYDNNRALIEKISEGRDGVDLRFRGQRLVNVFDPANIRRTDAAFDPSQSGSSKLLAGMGASPEAVGAGVGGAAGYALAPDQNGDGVVDAQERAAGGLGGFASGIVGAKAVRGAGNTLKNIAPPKVAPTGPVQATFGGVKAKTADLKLQRIAQDMEKAGASRDQIWKETGWFKGNDGKWRFEIDDSGARLRSNEEVSAIGESMVQTARDLEARVKQSNASLREQPDLFPAALKRAHSEMRKRAKGIREKAGENFGPQWNEYNGRRLEYDLDHPAMIAAYPQLARDLIISRPGPSRHSPTLKGSYSDNRIKLNGPRNSNQTSTTLHETQHALQDVEGFAQGGSPESAYMADGLRQEWAQEIDKILTPAPFEKFAANPVFDGVAEAEVRRQYKTMVDEMRAASKDIYHPLSKTVQQTAAYNIYKRLAGEVEARNVQTRRDFTPEERRARPPWTTQDVPDDQQIVRYGSGQANAAPLRKTEKPFVTPPPPTGEVVRGPSYKGGGGGGGGFRPPPRDDWPAAARYGLGGMAGSIGGTTVGGLTGSVADLDGDGVAGTLNDQRIGASVGLGVGVGTGLGAAHLLRRGAIKRATLPSGKAVEESADAILQRHGYRDGVSAQKTVISMLRDQKASPERISKAERVLAAIERRFKDSNAVLSGEKLQSNVASIKAPPTQQGFGGSPGKSGGKKPPGNALASPPKKPGPVLSRAAQQATDEVKKARRLYNAAARRWVMKDDRELRVKPLEDELIKAEARLAQVLQNDARIKVAGARIKGTVEKTLDSQTRSTLAGVGLGGAGSFGLILGYNALNGNGRDKDVPPAPGARDYYWNKISKREDAMKAIQFALAEDWDSSNLRDPTKREIDEDGKEPVRLWPAGQEITGSYGSITRDAIRRWRYDRKLDPDAPMTKDDVIRLLAGKGGYEQGGNWYRGDGSKVVAPAS